MVGAVGGHRLFPRQFAFAVLGKRVGGIGLDIGLGRRPGAVKDVVGGDVEQAAAQPLRRLGQIFRAEGVDAKGQFDLGFAGVDGGVGGAVDDRVRAAGVQVGVDACLVADIDAGQVAADRLVFGGEQAAAVRAELAVGADDDYFHERILLLCLSSATKSAR